MAIPKTAPAPLEARVQEIMEIFAWCYNNSTGDLQRMESFQRMYDNTVNESAWPTVSKMPIPVLFTMVAKALPPIMSGLFPKNQFIRLMPQEEGVDMESVAKVEQAVQQNIINRMRLQHYALATVKDCMKLSVGYGIIEPVSVSPAMSSIATLRRGQKVIQKSRLMQMAPQKLVERFKYVSPGQVIVSKDGTDFNGHSRVSYAFYLDTYSEQQFRNLFAKSPKDGEGTPIMKGNVEEIIAEARTSGFYANVPVVNMIAKLGGVDINMLNKADTRIPVRIPVLKMYAENEHVWIANGTKIIYSAENQYQTMRTPLVKCSAWPEGDRFYPMSSTEAAQPMGLGVNVWMNAMFDLLTYHLKPMMAYDKTKTGNKPPERGPNSEIGMAGDVNTGIRFLEPPQMQAGMFTVGEFLQRAYGSAVGQEAFLQEGSPGLLRGGAYAFESLLNTSTARDILTSAILQTGFIEPTVLQTMIYMQLRVQGGTNDVYRIREYNAKQRKEVFRTLEITENDIIHAFDVSLDMPHSGRNETAAKQGALSEFNVLKGDPMVDQWELRSELLYDESKIRRLLLPKEDVRKMQEEDRETQLAAARAAAQPAQQAPSLTPEQQALAGAARVTGA